MSTAQEVKQRVTEKMDHAIEHMKRDLAGLRTGRASVALVDGIKVDYYGTLTPLKQVANVATPEARLITIQPWEQNLIREIEKAIQISDLGLTPSNDGKLIRIPLPPQTEERRGPQRYHAWDARSLMTLSVFDCRPKNAGKSSSKCARNTAKK